ncbi:MAG: malate dehydrogenase (quinone) [Flavobacteriales bacterium]
MSNTSVAHADVVLIGSGIMSATLGVLLKELDPTLRLRIIERMPEVAAESSDAWNNAGTGHAALCELNYTPERPDGSIDISKALKIDEQFELSKQWWAWLVERGKLPAPRTFIDPVPHMSFVRGAKDVDYLRRRHAAMNAHHLFAGMAFSDDPATIGQWAPLLMEGRDAGEPIAATRSTLGTDLDFGALTRALFAYLTALPDVHLQLSAEVRDLARRDSGLWAVEVKDLVTDERQVVLARTVFIGAGGGAMPLLERSGIPEAKGYAGFPVSGQWLRCLNKEVIGRHHAKVYGKAATGTPPMSVPHLDTRSIGEEPALLFGPFAGFSTKFLKHGSWLDLPASLNWSNILPLMQAGWDNMDLTKYLLEQVRLTPDERLAALRGFMPTAQLDDWELAVAGQRVQVIKRDANGEGVLEFGTELVASADGSLVALLGASPGASTAVAIMLDLLARCFPERLATPAWQEKLRSMIPSYGRSLANDAALARQVRAHSHRVLQLAPVPAA